MLSESAFEFYVWATYAWFVIGALIIGVGGIRDGYRLLKKDK